MNDIEKIKALQSILGVTPDGIFGPKSRAALEALILNGLIEPPSGIEHHVIASSFADPADVKAFHKWFQIYKDLGFSDKVATKKALNKGDNALGVWEDDTSAGSGPSCALPPEKMKERWGSIDAAKHQLVLVSRDDHEVTCVLKDIMPPEGEITTAARIDLNPDAVAALGLVPPIMAPVVWKWLAV